MTVATIELNGASKRFGRQWVAKNIDLVLHQGTCVGLVGHNGAGKSTLIKLMLGLLHPDAGEVRVLGQDPAKGRAAVRAALGYLPENVTLHPGMTAAETLDFYARLKRQDCRGNAALLERVGLADVAQRRVITFSKGMRQRLGLAQALLGAPRALLLDEPTTGLDPALRQDFYQILRELRAEGAAILLSSHALAELAGEVDRVVVINHGSKIADGDIQTLRALAGVRPRIRLRLARTLRAVVNGDDPWADWQRLPGGVLELPCDEADIVPSLRTLPSDVAEVEIVRPSLDEVYAAFLRQEVLSS